MLIYDELPTAFPWYNKKEKQQRFVENAMGSCNYKLISPSNGLLPFQIQLPETETEKPIAWEIRNLNDGLAIDISNNIDLLRGKLTDTAMYVAYTGDELTFIRSGLPEPLDMPKGKYYSVLIFPEDKIYYSEVFTVPDEGFKIGEPNRYIKLEYWNDCDIAPLLYSLGGTQFKQVLYIDTFIHSSEPEIEEDGERDDNDQLIPTFQKMIVKYRFSVIAPSFIKISLISMQMHSNIFLTTENDARSGSIDRMTTSTTVQDNGYYSIVDVVLEQVVLVKKACCENMPVVNENPWS